MKTDIIVIGGGHGGIEAAQIAAKSDLDVMLITSNIDTIGNMSCNPAIGGIAKGNMAREIDALGGLMGKTIDKTGIQFRMLNKSKGLAVWGPRAQADKFAYAALSRKYLDGMSNLSIYQDTVVEILVSNNTVSGVKTECGYVIHCKAVILTMGTFLNGTGWIGMNTFSCGRKGEPPSLFLSESIQSFGIKSGRLKTGTPVRLNKDTVDFSKLKEQPGDDEPWPFSFSTREKITNKTVCWELKSNLKTHDIIRENLHQSPLYSGMIKSVGPRYCPSIEDKIVKFGDRNGHTLHLEPEGLNTKEMYLNGFSTSLPFDVQLEMIHSLDGLENAQILKPGYAIEYDYFLPSQLKHTLESRVIENLFFAGQINGTSGYEEAGGQGIIAGINALCKLKNWPEFVLSRDSSYIGVLIDDLITKGTDEPYRMFTARAEYRLLLRQDNADERLMPLVKDMGLIDEDVYEYRSAIWKKRKDHLSNLKNVYLDCEQWNNYSSLTKLTKKSDAHSFLKRPEVTIKDYIHLGILDETYDNDILGLEADIKYEGFILKQQREIERQGKIDTTEIPSNLDYDTVGGLLTETREKLKNIKPVTLGQASRISGVTPADISVLMLYLSRISKK